MKFFFKEILCLNVHIYIALYRSMNAYFFMCKQKQFASKNIIMLYNLKTKACETKSREKSRLFFFITFPSNGYSLIFSVTPMVRNGTSTYHTSNIIILPCMTHTELCLPSFEILNNGVMFSYRTCRHNSFPCAVCCLKKNLNLFHYRRLVATNFYET